MLKVFKRIKKVVGGIYSDIFKYIYFPPFDLKPIQDCENAWYLNNKVLPHAFGKINNETYTNSKEALDNALNNGVKAFECDVCMTCDNVPVMAHEISENLTFDEFINSKIRGQFTPLSLEMIVNLMRENQELFFFIDTKNGETKFVAKWLKENAIDVIDRFIVQIGYIKDYKEVCKIHKFKYFHWNFSIDRNVNQHLAFVVRNKIYTCSVPHHIIKNNKTLRYLKKYNVKPYAYTINSSNFRDELYNKGVWGIISDDLFC